MDKRNIWKDVIKKNIFQSYLNPSLEEMARYFDYINP